HYIRPCPASTLSSTLATSQSPSPVVALFLSTANALPLEKREENAAGKCWGSVVGNVRYCPYETTD
ncbi:hypothetical protein BGZ92_005032, partial [Podila epicladia]